MSGLRRVSFQIKHSSVPHRLACNICNTFQVVLFHSQQSTKPLQKVKRSLVLCGSIWKTLPSKPLSWFWSYIPVNHSALLVTSKKMVCFHIPLPFFPLMLLHFSPIRNSLTLLWRHTRPLVVRDLQGWSGKAWLNSTCKADQIFLFPHKFLFWLNNSLTNNCKLTETLS